jgi:hypothetical protein
LPTTSLPPILRTVVVVVACGCYGH